MHPYSSHFVRPTVETARQYLQNGGGPIVAGSLISESERAVLLLGLSEDLEATLKKHFPRTKNLEYAILKCHLLIEYVIERYISCMSFYELKPESIRLTFAQKLDAAAMLGFGAYGSRTIPSIEMLNRARNQVAHRLEVDTTVIDEIYRWWAEDADDVNKATDIDRIRFLKWFCFLVAGSTSGQLHGMAMTAKRDKR